MKRNAERMGDIADEIADVAIYPFLLANGLDINLKEAIDQKIMKNTIKYPVD